MPDAKRSGPHASTSRHQPPPTTTHRVTRIGCPCGCRTTPWFDDPDCMRHQPIAAALDWPAYDVRTLGLDTHDRTLCASCQAVGA